MLTDKHTCMGGAIICRDNRTKNESRPEIPPVSTLRNPILDPLAALLFEVGYRAIQRGGGQR
ncbi:MAG: hypothetical protein DMF60_12910 [Acidobacteria bacterium]|nr:MAG: hypothetical protein DMF60_12910 [Acidobacteriota bacterium]